MAGALAALLFRKADPLPPRRRYSWEIEEEEEAARRALEADMFEPSRPDGVPVLWHRDAVEDERGVVLAFRRPGAGERDIDMTSGR